MCHTERVAAALLMLAAILPCGACAQRWTFARAGYPSAGPPEGTLPPVPPMAGTTGYCLPAESQNAAPPVFPGPGQLALSDYSPVATVAFQPLPDMLDSGVLPAEALPPAAAFQPPAAAFQPPGGPAFDPLYTPAAQTPEFTPLPGGARLEAMWQQAKHDIYSDHANYYSWNTMRDLALGIAVASPVANTSLDQHFRDWYQHDVRSTGTDNFASFWKTFGEGQIFIPSFAGLALVGQYFGDGPLLGTAGDYGGRVTRAYLVGGPPMLVMQYFLGGGRPDDSGEASYWRPFCDSHGVSGHAFISSVPFITAANMVENPLAKGTFYILSTFTAWSRINDDAHYLSQACLGWWMGYLACRAVDDTARESRQFTITPIATPDMIGAAMVYQY